ncbi:MAG TPA: AAA family ATPase, partial [Burkholderiales bacterium]|nr:AAA family ATPase [Burkholderiales bacterium]
SKTKLAGHIGKYLGWPVLSVDPSYLVQEGLDRIQALANRLFSMLTMTEQVVVLLDEFDEMGRDRARAEELLSRFITTAMLPKLASINDERKIVFLLATNYISGFDAAFSRGGRFDMLVQVMPPKVDVKLTHPPWAPLKACYDTLSADRQRDAKPLLEDLTFAEYDALNAKAAKLTTPDTVFAEIQAVHVSCTLSQTNEINAHGNETGPDAPTWKDTSISERKRIRIDLSNVP